MPNGIKITADSTCDLSKELLEQYDITLVPLYVVMGEETRKDGVDIRPEDIYRYVEKTGEISKTSAASVQDYLDLFRPLVEGGSTVIHINISAEFSSCYQNACIAAEEVGNVYVIDSRNLSTGSGHVVLEAAIRAKQGMPAEQIIEEVRQIVPKVDASFVLDTLSYLHKGGRCSSVAALGANLLKLKPCIEVKDGKMGVGKKFRGALIKCVEQYIDARLEGHLDDIRPERIFITHTACPQEILDIAWKTVKKYGYFAEIIETTAGCTITNHCGPATLGILYIHR